jgi:hypothetical protein
MKESWRGVVADLAGPGAKVGQTVTAEWDGMVVAELVVPGAAFRIPGTDEDEAWSRVAHALGDFRLVQSLEAAGWTIVEEVTDETTYVVARDPGDLMWAIGVASADGDRRAYIERDIGYDNRVFNRIAYIEPIDTRSASALTAALAGNTRLPTDDRS